tara:strand:- start:59 stop:772 length:714 start_codon:yes stop_codon:yes gene_type:complete
MGITRGSISTPIIVDGLVLNLDAANRASTIPNTSTLKTFNTIDLSQSGSITTDATWEDGTPPTFAFDGSDGYIELGNLTFLNNAVNASWGFWAKINADANQMPFGQWDGSNNFFYFYFNGASRIRIAMNGGFVWDLTSSGLNGLDTWRYYVITLDGSLSTSSERVKLYINSTVQSNSTAGPTALGTATSNFNIGRREASGGSYYFNGDLPMLHIYNRTLSSTEVLHNYNALKGRFGL